MFLGIIVRIIAILILLFNAVVLLGAAIQSLGNLIRRQPDTNIAVAVLFLALSFVLGVWILGLIQRVAKAGWPNRFMKNLRTNWVVCVGVLLVSMGLYLLFDFPIELYASLGFIVGTSFAELALRQIASMPGIDLPPIIVQIVAWEFHLCYASLIVGFCVWVMNAVKSVARRGKRPPLP